jgi:hypothetical protein
VECSDAWWKIRVEGGRRRRKNGREGEKKEERR